MTTDHDIEYPIWFECDHSNPDESDDTKYDCLTQAGSCVEPAWPIAWPRTGGNVSDWFQPAPGPKCQPCTLFETDQDWFESTHVIGGEGVDGDSVGPLCQLKDPIHVCKECSEEAGDWIPHTDICPGCDREAGVDDDFGRDENCGHCFIDGAPETQAEVTSPAYYNTDCWCEERSVRDCPVHGPCFCGSPKCEACAP